MNNLDQKTVRNVVLVAAAVIVRADGAILLAQRPAGRSMAGLWEFPGGKVEPSETPEAALVRELAEELDIVVAPADLSSLTFASHAYDDFHLLMPLYLITKWQGEPSPHEGQALTWVALGDLRDYDMPPADAPLIPMLEKMLA